MQQNIGKMEHTVRIKLTTDVNGFDELSLPIIRRQRSGQLISP